MRDRTLGEHMHPRPQLQRGGWASLDGEWEFADDRDGRWRMPAEVEWAGATINVPFAPEAPASGIGDTGFRKACWYRRPLEVPAIPARHRLVLRFGAVDHLATVWIDGHRVASHEGGYSPFEVDLTELDAGHHVLVVRAEDDPAELSQPRGKQDWELVPHSIWYHRTTGIWQTVWMEELPPTSVDRLHWTADIERFELRMEALLGGDVDDAVAAGDRLRVRLTYRDLVLADDLVGLTGKRVERVFRLDGTRVDTMRDELLWTPDNPALIDAEITVVTVGGTVVDRVESYAGMRTVAVRAGRFVLNDRPFPLRMVLDQGYWPESGLTPPDPDAFRRDIELTKALGFNGVRKHQKIEDPRYLAWADRLGLLVWEEMPPAYRFDGDAVRRTVEEWTRAVQRDRSHPCVVAWVPFNESAGMLSLSTSEQQRRYVEAVAVLTKVLDPTRLVVANDGWEVIGGDIIGIHDYERNPDALAHRYGSGFTPDVITGYAAHGRLGVLDDPSAGERVLMLTEFGGIGFGAGGQEPVEEMPEPLAADRINQPAAWGYSTVGSPEELLSRYADLVAAVTGVDRLAGFCYTQLTDTYQEVNGLLRGDRTPKAPIEAIARATRGDGLVPPAPVPARSLRAVRKR